MPTWITEDEHNARQVLYGHRSGTVERLKPEVTVVESSISIPTVHAVQSGILHPLGELSDGRAVWMAGYHVVDEWIDWDEIRWPFNAPFTTDDTKATPSCQTQS